MLAWHVDYWDYLGWKDPFGRKEFTLRQRRYQKALGLKNIWTPGLFVDNQVVRKANRVPALAKAGAQAKARVRIDGAARLEKGKVLVTAKLAQLDPELKPAATTGVFAVLWRKEATTTCNAGENRGRTLKEFYIALEAARPVPLATAFEKGTSFAFAAPEGVAAKDLGVALLVEDPGKMKTLDCVNVAVTAAKPR